MSYGEISCRSDHTANDQWLFSSSLINGKFNRENINKIFIKDEELKKKISWDELDDILRGCEKTTGFFLCTRFVLLLIISFAITAITLLAVAFYLTSKKYDKTSVIYTYVIAITIGVFCNLLLFLIYLLISNIYEKQLNLYLGQRRIVTLYEAKLLYWRAHGTRITLNIIYKRKCDSNCGNDYIFTKAQKNKSNFLSQVEMKNPLLQT